MNKNKKIFIGFCILFFLILLYIGYDISRKTTFPGGRDKKDKLHEEKLDIPADSIIILENT
ncbi:MAG: hypothetical protein M3512_03970 [Bacteroidota bacterium]|nr:hypothetical protein [Bacteroidota bacterium]